MSPPSPTQLHLLAVAAHLAATGKSWDKIGQAVGRSAETCRRWPQRYPEDWDRLYRQSRIQYLSELSRAAAGVVASLLTSKNDWLRFSAGRFLVGNELRLLLLKQRLAAAEPAGNPPADPPGPTSDPHRFADYLVTLNEQQLAQQTDDLLQLRERRQHRAGAADAGSPADPPVTG
jgi:hypothetical protein